MGCCKSKLDRFKRSTSCDEKNIAAKYEYSLTGRKIRKKYHPFFADKVYINSSELATADDLILCDIFLKLEKDNLDKDRATYCFNLHKNDSSVCFYTDNTGLKTEDRDIISRYKITYSFAHRFFWK